MLLKGWIRLNSQEALDLFRREHYLHVYTVALELTHSPVKAHELASLVFANVAQRFANRPISKDCDLYLTAQVNLLYAQGALQAPFYTPETPDAAAPVKDAPARPAPAAPDADTAAAGIPNAFRPSAAPQAAASAAPVPMPSATGASPAPAASMPKESGAGSQPTATAAFSTPIGFDPLVGNAAVPTPETFGFPPAASAAAAPYLPPEGSLGTPAVTTVGEPIPTLTTSAVSAQPASALTASAATAAPDAAAVAAPAAAVRESASVYEAIYNPDDTEFWTPTGEARSTAPIEEVPEQTAWDDENEDRPSVFLSILNGVLTLGGLASAVYLLLQLNLFPRIF